MPPAPAPRLQPPPRRHWLLATLLVCTACDVNPYDPAQQPTVRVESSVNPVRMLWQPDGAQLVRVYRGAEAGTGYGPALAWSVAASGTNTLASGLVYGAAVVPGGTIDVAAAALVAGERYTVEVTRSDPKGGGDGFTNTRNRYVGTATFTAPPSPQSP